MTVKIGTVTFDNASYDAHGDVLYLSVGEPRPAADGEETPEGHALRFDKGGNVIGLTLIHARWLLDRDGSITVTMSGEQNVPAADLAEALAAS